MRLTVSILVYPGVGHLVGHLRRDGLTRGQEVVMAKRGNGEGSVRRNLERGRWEGRLTVDVDEGRPVRRMVTGRTRAEVVQRMRALRDADDAGQTPARRDLTVGRFLDDWLAALPGKVSAG